MYSSSFTVEIYHNAYYNLISLGWIEDFLIIHLLYFLGTSVHTFYYLSHDRISKKKNVYLLGCKKFQS